MRYDLWFSNGGQAGIVSSQEPNHPVRAVLYGPRDGEEGTFLSLKLDDRSIVPLNIPLSPQAERALSTCNWVYFGVLRNGTVTSSFQVPLIPAHSDTHWTGLDGAKHRPTRTVAPFIAFLKHRAFGEPLHVPDEQTDHAPPHSLSSTTNNFKVAPALAFYGASCRESPPPVSLGRAWRRTGPDTGKKPTPLRDLWGNHVS